jgi:hypothetical protein
MPEKSTADLPSKHWAFNMFSAFFLKRINSQIINAFCKISLGCRFLLTSTTSCGCTHFLFGHREPALRGIFYHQFLADQKLPPISPQFELERRLSNELTMIGGFVAHGKICD